MVSEWRWSAYGVAIALIALLWLRDSGGEPAPTARANDIPVSAVVVEPDAVGTGFDLALAAEARLDADVRYDGSYRTIAYPGGDVSPDTGVCTDVIIRSYRTLGIDLQELVHEDMVANFSEYPQNWGLSRPDSNIDHRRVPNLMTFFERSGGQLTISQSAANYVPGDIVAWRLDNGLLHIGVVSKYRSKFSGNPLLIHNIGAGLPA